ncbi:hypothetical protein F5144DRAFT_604393 [Chaetomium tenue]|uniref:Uncharacterized protein n=1 Tax=Chaetomium tenue TaxID=1854479 RepID=A0ACB7P2F4_9PEZI|nr:hypothetical protein F5144DRAFT_604393 [Chaetomium globosum]
MTEDELRNFTLIYPRLYQVAKLSQARIRAWALYNKDVIKHWDVGDFFKTKAADIRDGTEPRNAGCPPEVMDMWKNRKDNVEELDECLSAIQAAASRLESLSGGLKNDDLIRKEICGKKRGHSLVEDTERNEDRDQRNLRAKHADSLDSPEDDCGITPEHGTLMSDFKDGANAKECQTNPQGDSPENPLLFDIGLLDPDQLFEWESSKYSDEPFTNFMQDPHDFEKLLWSLASEEQQAEAANSQARGNKGKIKIHGGVEECTSTRPTVRGPASSQKQQFYR